MHYCGGQSAKSVSIRVILMHQNEDLENLDDCNFAVNFNFKHLVQVIMKFGILNKHSFCLPIEPYHLVQFSLRQSAQPLHSC